MHGLLLVAALSHFYVFASSDGGVSWKAASAGIPSSKRINALAINGQVSYAGTDEGLFVSADEGETWTRAALETMRVQSLLVTSDRIYAGTNAGIFRSSDSGATWFAVLPSLNVRALAKSGSVIFAGTDTNGVFASNVRGEWQPLGQGLPAGAQVFDLAANGRYVYAALYSKGLYRLGIERWEKVDGVKPLAIVARDDVLVAGHNPGGIQRSADGGKTWDAAAGVSRNAPIWTMASTASVFFAGTTPGVLVRSDDAGATWTPSAAGLPSGAAVIAIAGDGSRLLAAIVIEQR